MTVVHRTLPLIPLTLLLAAAPAQDLPTVFGLALGKPLSIPVCARKLRSDGTRSDVVYEDDPPQTCYEPDIQLSDAPWRRGSVDFPLKRMPLIIYGNKGFTQIIDGQLEGLEFNTLGYSNTDSIISELTTKFGPPTAVFKTKTVVSGIAVPARQADWKRANFYVSYLNIDRNIEYGAADRNSENAGAAARPSKSTRAGEYAAIVPSLRSRASSV